MASGIVERGGLIHLDDTAKPADDPALVLRVATAAARRETRIARASLDRLAAGATAFDVTPSRYVTAIICERGVARAPYAESLRALVEGAPPSAR